jgi:hypothetical protein
MTLNPVYISQGSAQTLVETLKTNVIAHVTRGALNWFTIKAYDVRTPPPSYPVAETDNVVAAPATNDPRETALCLSFYSEHNRPSQRGRLYIPKCMIPGQTGVRPTTAQQQTVMDFAHDVLVLEPGVGQWAIWSPTHKSEHVVTNYWCDDEWDTMRSRGLKATSRLTNP